MIAQLFRYWGKGVPTEPETTTEASNEEPKVPEAILEIPEEELIHLRPLALAIKEAGAGSPAFDDASEHMVLFLPDLKGKENQVGGIRIVGDSMEPLLYEGDIAVVWFRGNYGPGTIVAIGIPNDGIVVKQLYYDKRGFPLMHSLNPKYPDEPLPEGAKVWGPVTQIIRPMPSGVAKKRLVKP
ncbi:MAG: S24 family peptidase [Meiothermus sp.]|uniref:S24 family peptidase n=1 Tax=Meiothermus sp. TaxID=1955249 RepID=UPI00298F1C23|nr:S24 family peptidase [Meiothermus sp.]MDW8482275.1 S24 family peptidase [Meiothermus sp.]